MALDLRCYLAGRPITARPASRVERVLRWCKRNPKLAATSGLAAASLIFALVMLGFWNQQKSAALYASRQNEALLALDRAIDHLDKDEGNLGLLWLGRALQRAPEEAADLQVVIRSNLSAVAGQSCEAQGNRFPRRVGGDSSSACSGRPKGCQRRLPQGTAVGCADRPAAQPTPGA